jgi:hypothetical protein
MVEESQRQKAARYQRMAEEAEEFAHKSRFPATREDYLNLARGWRLLAEQSESTHSDSD